MSSSGTMVFEGLRSEIIKDALYTINAIPAGTYDQMVASGDTEIMAHAARVLNRMALDWQNEGINLWKIDRVTQALVASTASYALNYTIADIMTEDLFIRNSNKDYQVKHITRREFADLPDKTQTGRPTMLYIERNASNAVTTAGVAHDYKGGFVLYPWPVPNSASDVLHYTALRKVQDASSDSQDADYPTRWQDALVFNLAYKLSFSYSVPADRVASVKAEAMATKARAQMDDKERGGVHFRVRCSYGIG